MAWQDKRSKRSELQQGNCTLDILLLLYPWGSPYSRGLYISSSAAWARERKVTSMLETEIEDIQRSKGSKG
jgi:hypothetical protein